MHRLAFINTRYKKNLSSRWRQNQRGRKHNVLYASNILRKVWRRQ
jgi:hypothetical protein